MRMTVRFSGYIEANHNRGVTVKSEKFVVINMAESGRRGRSQTVRITARKMVIDKIYAISQLSTH